MVKLDMKQSSPQPLEACPESELVCLARAGAARAFDVLSDRYLPILHSRAGRYSNIVGVDVEDFIQEGMLALYRAVMGYDDQSGIRFSTYAITCINNSMTSAIRQHMKDLQKGAGIHFDDMDERKLMELTSLNSGEKTVEELYFDKEAIGYRARQIEILLSNFERHVLKLYLGGQSYQSIAGALNTSTKAVDNALQRVRRKLRPEL